MSADYNLHIRTSADESGLQQTASGLEELIRKSKALGLDTTALETKLKQVNAELGKKTVDGYAGQLQKLITEERTAGRSTADLEQRLKGLNTTADRGFGGKMAEGLRNLTGQIPGVGALSGAVGALGTVLTGVAAAALAFFAVITKGLKEFAEAQKATIDLNSALASTGQFTGEASSAVQDLAKEYQRFTGVSDETWQQAAAVLLQFGIEVNSLPKYFPVIEALAGRMGGNVPAAAEAFAKAINGNFRPLQQLGIYIKDANTEQERFEALQKASASGAGVLRAQNEGLAGSWSQLSTAIGDAWEALGGVVNAAGVPQFFSTLAETITDLTGLFEKAATPIKKFFDLLPGGNDALTKLHEGQNKAAQSTERVAQRTEELKLKMEEGATATDAMGTSAQNLVPPLNQAATAAVKLAEKISGIDKAGALLREAKFGALDEQGKLEANTVRMGRLKLSIDDVFRSVGKLPPAADASAERIYLLAQSLDDLPQEKVGGLLVDFIKLAVEIDKTTEAKTKATAAGARETEQTGKEAKAIVDKVIALQKEAGALRDVILAESTSTKERTEAIQKLEELNKKIKELTGTQGELIKDGRLEKWLLGVMTAADSSATAIGNATRALQKLYAEQGKAPNSAAPYGGNQNDYLPQQPGVTGLTYVAPAPDGSIQNRWDTRTWEQRNQGQPGTNLNDRWITSGSSGQQNAVQQGAAAVQSGLSEMAHVTAGGFNELAQSVKVMHESVRREIAKANTDIKALQRLV